MTPEEILSDDKIIAYIADKTGLESKEVSAVYYIGDTWFAEMLRPIAQAFRDSDTMNIRPDISLDAMGELLDYRLEKVINDKEVNPHDTHIDRIANLTNLPSEIIMEIGMAFIEYFEGVFESFKCEYTKDDT